MASFINQQKQQFAEILGGQFVMGRIPEDTNAGCLETNRSVSLADFYLQETPVTNEQYRRYMESEGIERDDVIEIWDGEWVPGKKFTHFLDRGGDFPVVGVSYHDALAYIEWVSRREDRAYRLPTEAEFEFASKAGCNCQRTCQQASLVGLGGRCRDTPESAPDGPHKVRQSEPNKLGLHDMHGLVWQWCSDWFWYYAEEDCSNPQGPKERPPFAPWRGEEWKTGRSIRGGSFSYPHLYSRCSNRHFSLEPDRNFNVGFRMALSVAT